MKVRRNIGVGVLVLGVAGLLFLRVVPPSFSDWRTVTVQPNQSLWELAQEYDPNADPRDVENAIQSHNQVDTTIQPGEMLQIPTKTESLWQRLGL